MSRIRWSETLRRNPVPQRPKFSQAGRLLVFALIAIVPVLAAGCWYWASLSTSANGLGPRAAYWPDQPAVQRRADVANIVWFTRADCHTFPSDLERLLQLIQKRHVSLTVVLANNREDRLLPSDQQSVVRVAYDVDGHVRRAFGVRQPVEFLIYDSDCRLIDTVISSDALAIALADAPWAPKLSDGVATTSAARYQVGRQWTLQVTNP